MDTSCIIRATMKMVKQTNEGAGAELQLSAAARHEQLLRANLTIEVETAAEILGIGRSTAYNAVRSGSIPAMKIEGRWLVPTLPLRKMLGLDDA